MAESPRHDRGPKTPLALTWNIVGRNLVLKAATTAAHMAWNGAVDLLEYSIVYCGRSTRQHEILRGSFGRPLELPFGLENPTVSCQQIAGVLNTVSKDAIMWNAEKSLPPGFRDALDNYNDTLILVLDAWKEDRAANP